MQSGPCAHGSIEGNVQRCLQNKIILPRWWSVAAAVGTELPRHNLVAVNLRIVIAVETTEIWHGSPRGCAVPRVGSRAGAALCFVVGHVFDLPMHTSNTCLSVEKMKKQTNVPRCLWFLVGAGAGGDFVSPPSLSLFLDP